MNEAGIRHNFTYHPPKDDQIEQYQRLRKEFCDLALMMDKVTSDSREKSLAFTKLEEANMWINAAIARNS